jgi:Tol biopolymer transport system component
VRALRLISAAAVVAAAVAATADATAPGRNGLIAFAQEVGGHYQLFTIRPDGSGAKQITHVRAADALNADWSPDGRKLVVEVDLEHNAEIAVVGADGTGLRILTPKGFQGQPSFSPDGKWIVYERDIAQGNNGVWLMHPDGTSVHRVTRNPGACCDTDPNFSPDGKLITFVRIRTDGKEQALFSVRPDGTGVKQLTPYSAEVAIKHDWAPDGKSIVVTTNADFVRPKQAANLATVKPDGSGLRQLTEFPAGKNAFAGSYSPDGKWIAFRLEKGDRYALAVIGRNGGAIRMLTPLSKNRPRFVDWGTHL